MVVNKPFALTAKCISYAHMKKTLHKHKNVIKNIQCTLCMLEIQFCQGRTIN